MSFVSVQKLHKSYAGSPVFENIDCHIERGEFVTLLGPSGCGKSTLLRCIAGLTPVDSGQILLDGHDIVPLSPQKRGIGMVFQSYALFPNMTVEQNVAFGLRMQKVKADESQLRVREALELVELGTFAGRYPHQLSGGQCQRVALARSLVTRPRLLLLDEPLSALDARIRKHLREQIRAIQRELGLTTIFVTHDQEEANTVCDRIAVFNEGSIQQVGTPMELYEQPANLFVANFLGTANILAGRVSGEGAGRFFEVEGGGRVPIPQDATVPDNARLVFRPQYARIGVDAPGATRLDAVVRHREFLGATIRYGLMVGQTEVLVDVPFQAGDRLLDAGTQTFVSLDPRSALWLAE